MSITQRDTTSAPASLWRNRDYLLLLGGQTLSTIGSAVSELAFPLLVLLVTHSPAQAGYVAALRALPALFLTLPAGALVDRWDRRRIMLACDIGRALSLATIPVAYTFGLLTIWQLFVAAFLEGALTVLFGLAKTAAVAQVVTHAHYSDAVTQDEVVEGVTALVGPSLSGALYTLGAMIPFLTDVVSYFVSLTTLALIRTPFQAERAPVSHRLWADIGSGVRWVWRQPFILSMTLMMGAGAFVLPGATLITIILAQRAGASAWMIGLIFAAGGIGAILGSWVASRLAHRLTVGQSILITRWFLALSWPFYALTPVPAALAALDFGAGFVDPIEDIAYFSHRLRLIPDKLKGRVISVCRLVPGVMRPLGLALTGFLIQRIGIFPTIWLLWIWLLLATILLTIVPYVRREREG
ncbi:MAG TPA: MFS transporter [Ktedonobacterales bacterium]|jgi:MFS family permease|nr:MFS transporter [Ktedonobacterales bacterium]